MVIHIEYEYQPLMVKPLSTTTIQPSKKKSMSMLWFSPTGSVLTQDTVTNGMRSPQQPCRYPCLVLGILQETLNQVGGVWVFAVSILCHPTTLGGLPFQNEQQKYLLLFLDAHCRDL